jgi:microcystin-dependent protein
MDPFIGEVRIFSFPFAPRGWAYCDGALLPIAQHTALFSILGIAFGGDGQRTFGLPNLLAARTPIGAGDGPRLTPRKVGATGGQPGVALTKDQVPTHSHNMYGTASPADVSSPTSTTALARTTGRMGYAPPANLTRLNAAAVGTMPAEGRPHNNFMPFQVVNYCIAIEGVFPSRG